MKLLVAWRIVAAPTRVCPATARMEVTGIGRASVTHKTKQATDKASSRCPSVVRESETGKTKTTKNATRATMHPLIGLLDFRKNQASVIVGFVSSGSLITQGMLP